MATYKSLESLKAAILKEVRSAVDAAAQESKNVLQKNVDEFYSIPEGRYHRIGMLQAAPQLDSVFETMVITYTGKCSTQSIMESLRIEKEYILFLLRKNWIMGSLNFQCHLTMVHV